MLPQPEKAEIIAKRRLKMATDRELAVQHRISEHTVHGIERFASPETLMLADERTATLAEQIREARDLALEVLTAKLAERDAPLAQVTQAFGTLYDKHQLETNRPTQIIANQTDPKDHAIAFFRMLCSKMTRGEALDAFRVADLAPLVSGETRDRVAGLLERGEIEA